MTPRAVFFLWSVCAAAGGMTGIVFAWMLPDIYFKYSLQNQSRGKPPLYFRLSDLILLTKTPSSLNLTGFQPGLDRAPHIKSRTPKPGKGKIKAFTSDPIDFRERACFKRTELALPQYKKGKLMNTDVFKILPLSEEEIIHIYTKVMPEHFPENELKPLSSIQALLQKKAYVGLGFYGKTDGETAGDLAGYALFLKIPGQDTVLLDYYAVLPHYRNLGVGSVFLGKMKNWFSDMDGFLLETEAPETAPNEAQQILRSRRNEFYYRNGAKMTSISSTLFGVTFHILYLPIGRDLTDSAIQKELEQIYRFMLPGDGFAKYVTIICDNNM